MAQQTIDAVREAERKADQAERDAAQQAEEILWKAHADAERTTAQITSEADKLAQDSLDAARAQGERYAAKAAQEAEQEIAALRALAQKREKEASACVIAELVGERGSPKPA